MGYSKEKSAQGQQTYIRYIRKVEKKNPKKIFVAVRVVK